MIAISPAPDESRHEKIPASPDDESDETPPKQLTVTFRNVEVTVNGQGENFALTCITILRSLNPFGRQKHTKRKILQNVSGQVRPGEMLLVLGRPGSGCTTLLKILSNQRDEYDAVTGDVRFGNAGQSDASSLARHIVMSLEYDQHFPTLTVEQTIDFAAANKVSFVPVNFENAKSFISYRTSSILSSLGISHIKDTIVGSEFVRGVSGGERKRVSIAEVMATQSATKAPLQCWDNSTRGLDATNALAFARVLRKSASKGAKTIIATLYQAGNGIYDQFDKVLVLAEGRQIYYGSEIEAKCYFENLGFVCPPGSNISDFLTSVTVPTERIIQPGCEGSVPTTADEFEQCYKSSNTFKKMLAQFVPTTDGDILSEAPDLREQESGRTWIPFLPSSKLYTASFGEQVWASILLQLCASLIIALVTGSLYFDLPTNTESLFARTGALCFPILYFAMTRMSETTASFMGRPILSRQKHLGLNRPSAHAFALVLVDIPVIVAVFSLFQLVYYFMVGFQREVEKFFICFLVLLAFTLSFASMYRMIGAWCRHPGIAFQINGALSTVLLVYIGYMIPLKNIPVWFRWMAWINPAVYAYNAIMANEMSGQTYECVKPQYLPFGSTYDHDSPYRGCSVTGSGNSSAVQGEVFIDKTYWAGKRYMWMNFGILLAFWIAFAIMTAIGFEVKLHRDSGSEILFDRKQQLKRIASLQDPERAITSNPMSETSTKASPQQVTFTFSDIDYFVHHQGQERHLLRGVSGFVKPGQLLALMGSSGAGKTTLMDVLAQRKDTGRIEGSILVNGKPQGVSFQRRTGYCEQNDVHEPTATVFESLLFSARLRQPYDVPDEEKVAYVQIIMDLLELTPLQHAIVGSPASGLSIEQRKRLTLATELVAKPSLLFLDEPTSGLDGQSAYEVCRLLRKLTASGQTIVCTIHQPSASLFANFDQLLLLTRGGRTAYFGPIGKDATTVMNYFSQRHAPCSPAPNPAEHIVDVVQGCSGPFTDWHKRWEESEERRQMMKEIESINAGVREATVSARDRDENDFATPLFYQLVLVTRRQAIALWRNPDYIWNKLFLHILNGLFGGFTFWKLGNGVFDMQLSLMAVFNFITVAPGCINQLQPLFIQNRDIFETREKKSMTYHWVAFVAAQNLAEAPVLILCGTLVFVCWYFPVGFPLQASTGQVYLQMILYEWLFTSIGQAIAACSPNAYFSGLANPIIFGTILINFSGVVVPFSQIKSFWRYWLYYLNPFTYLLQGLLTPAVWDRPIECKQDELTQIPLPSSSSCGQYMAEFLRKHGGYIINPNSTTLCSYCPYETGADYLRTVNINESYYGWRGVSF
ncbi:ABC multidrug transporter [Ilyonectria robusta]